MDHLLIPKHPARSTPRVRYYCQQQYDGEDFLYYPKRMGWTYKELLSERAWFNLGLHDSERDPETNMARWSYLGLPDGKRKVEDVLAFLQQWLFFGILHTFLGDLALSSDFIETDLDTGLKYVHTRNLLPLARKFLEKERHDRMVPRRGFEYFNNCLSAARQIYEAIRGQSPRSTLLDPYFILSLATMAQFLADTAATLYPDDILLRDHRPPLVHNDDDRFKNFRDDRENIDILTFEMAKAGWCPRQAWIAAGTTLPTYYFYSQLQYFEAEHKVRDHRECSQTQCLSLRVDSSTYKSRHIHRGECDLVGFKTEDLDGILQEGNIPLAVVDENKKLQLRMVDIDAEVPTYYVAISHVWSDGLGNPNANSMPMCQLRCIDEIVSGFSEQEGLTHGKTPFWIDTLCCPAKPSRGKSLAIQRMRETYQKAASVVVLSADLETVDAWDLSYMERACLVSLSSWSSRLWTLQEGVLARALHIEFANSIISYSPLSNEKFSNTRGTLDLGWLSETDIANRWSRTRGGAKVSRTTDHVRTPTFSIIDGVVALSRRTTSVKEDEAICLGSLWGADMALLTKTPREDRLKALWTNLSSVPSSLAFWPEERMQDPGFRWAPLTFLGIRHTPGDFEDTPLAKVTPQGLLLRARGFVFQDLASPLRFDLNHELCIEDQDSRELYWLILVLPEGQRRDSKTLALPDSEFSQVALLIWKPEHLEDSYSLCTMVFVYKVDDGVTYAHRGDSANLYSPMLRKRRIHGEREVVLKPQRSGANLAKGEEFVKTLWGREVYCAVRGEWDEERAWCID